MVLNGCSIVLGKYLLGKKYYSFDQKIAIYQYNSVQTENSLHVAHVKKLFDEVIIILFTILRKLSAWFVNNQLKTKKMFLAAVNKGIFDQNKFMYIFFFR
jgi:hypothetical protein